MKKNRVETGPKKESVLDGFLFELRSEGVEVSIPEWLNFLTLVKEKFGRELEDKVDKNIFLPDLRLLAKISLIKNREDEAIFYDVFDRYFNLRSLKNKEDLELERGEFFRKEEIIRDEEPELSNELNEKPQGGKKENQSDEKKSENQKESGEPEMKESLGIDEVDENLDLPENQDHGDNESVHGGKNDQHNDILRQEDENKIGGGDQEKDKKNSLKEEGEMIGSGKGNSLRVEKLEMGDVGIRLENEKKKIEIAKRADKRLRYEVRPGRENIKEVIKKLRKIILDVSRKKTNKVNVKKTVSNFAKRNLDFVYESKIEKQPEIVLLVDVGGPVDEWSPLINELSREMTKGLSKLEVYLFHNNIYGYVWKADTEELSKSSFPKPNSLIDVKKIIKNRKKVIIYGDAEMSETELYEDMWEPQGNEKKVEKFGMGGVESLKFIKRKAGDVVWINPIFRKEWERRDISGTIENIGKIIPMYDLSLGGVEDAIRDLMKK